ncbi:SLBB domain-containing protein [candidate division KSB1 bacterium]|nr:SLBB domain-containing protein [candidate division KSB1 bacterium]MBL7093240.1 SLBB domain-containing protein [candidate division KSB1 bacterium]
MAFKKSYISSGFVFVFLFVFLLSSALPQQDVLNRNQYKIGTDERLMITVHIFGEIQKPGEYLVPDNTNIMEIISKAGGPTEFSNLSKVKITRGLVSIDDLKKALKMRVNKRKPVLKQVIKINLKRMLDNERSMSTLPTLKPGDVVRVGRNGWFAWQTVVRIISQLAIVAQVWYWYSQ